ncbi:hypothetical protein [Neptunicoccus sediminis]|uniref:hypothetical protein n=1 Tax=Neptunicoccus sediminis TaxID=1892596 RepID=UPI00084622EC|nr:hypothetical protein [Neptunicoccus sediminis]
MMENKTYKREVAIALLVVMFLLFAAGFYDEYFKEIGELLVSPVFLFSGASFGLDSFSKQMRK